MSSRSKLVITSALVLLGARGLAAGTAFVRGDCDAGGGAGCSITDPIFLLSHLFTGSDEPPCHEACDANDDGGLDIADAVYMLQHCFAGGPPPPAPYPSCGEEPDPGPGLGCGEFLPCAGSCAPQDARGVGACLAIVGIFWDGSRCLWHSGCSCEGADCGESFESLEACYAAHESCATPCDAMTVRGVGACKLLLGFYWNGRQCRSLGGCECEGEDCDRLYDSEEQCTTAVVGCPASCTPMDVHEVGLCEPVHGYFWNGKECKVLSGCECGGPDCDKLFTSPDECAAAHAACQ